MGIKSALVRAGKEISFASAFLARQARKMLPRRIEKEHVLKAAFWSAVLSIFLFLLQAFFQADLKSDPATPILEDRRGVFLSEGENEYARLGFWDMPDPIPERIFTCVLSIEDKRYEMHMGVDWWSLGRALINNLGGKKIQGASTIPMQVARLQNPDDRTIFAKLNEIVVAWFLLVRHGHENVLRHYMKIAPQGNQVHGFAYASRRYFQKPVMDLSWAEAALLAALPQSPSAMNVFNYWGFQRALSRARLILKSLFQEKKINANEYQVSLKQLSEMNFQFKEKRPDDTYHFIFRAIQEYEKQNRTRLEKPLRTTLDTDLQKELQETARLTMRSWRALGAGNISIMVVERKTGAVLGYIGSADYFDGIASGSINYAHAPRSSGSTVKPFLYALGFDTSRFSPSSIVADLPFSIIGPKGEFSVGNFDQEYMGPMLFRRALANSRNTPTIRVLENVGLERTYELFKECGLGDGKKPASYYGYGLPVGGLYVTLEDLVAAYGILANDGMEFRLKWFSDDQPNAKPRRILSEYSSRQISLILSDPLARLPSFPRLSSLEFPFPVAIKTGTSQGYRDAWAIAYSRRYIVGVWIGHPENARMNHVSGSFVASLVHDIMLMLHPDETRGVNVEPFPLPRNCVAVEICALSGRPSGKDCSEVFLEYFKDGTEPHDRCPVHKRFKVDRLTGELAKQDTPPERVEERLFTVLPAEYASWGARRGYGKPPVEPSAGEERAQVRLVHPLPGSSFLIDPELPRRFQSIALRAEVVPFVPEVIWLVDGREYARVRYPYETRWNLTEGEHSFQVRFPNAFISSQVISIKVSGY